MRVCDDPKKRIFRSSAGLRRVIVDDTDVEESMLTSHENLGKSKSYSLDYFLVLGSSKNLGSLPS